MSNTNWQDTLANSTKKAEQGAKYRKQAGILLWDGSVEAVNEYVGNADNDPTGEKFQADVLAALGERRKGDASKIKTVALAVVGNGLDLDGTDFKGKPFTSLNQAYAEATRLTKTVKVHAAEDEAADTAVQSIEAPKTATAPEGAAKIVMAQGVDEAARLLLSALGTTEHAAHKAFIRAIAQEAAGLIPKPEPKPKAEPKPKGAAKKAVAKDGAAKAKVEPVAAKAKPVKRAAKKAAAPVEAPADDMFADLDDDDAPAPEVAENQTAAKPKPVRRGPVKRG